MIFDLCISEDNAKTRILNPNVMSFWKDITNATIHVSSKPNNILFSQFSHMMNN